MAVPKVFISSTCFDLSEIREQLSRFISNYGFEPVLSEHGDVFIIQTYILMKPASTKYQTASFSF